MRTTSFIIFISVCIIAFSCIQGNRSVQQDSWKDEFKNSLDMLGHRNWILVVDKAFPEQSSPGMRYIYVEEELLPVLKFVLDEIDASTHVSPVIYRDMELSYIIGEQVPGINDFRAESKKVLAERDVQTLLHDEVFRLLDQSSALFRVLVIKTRCTLPYTSVFIQLDCAYWNPQQEEELRTNIPHPTFNTR